MKLLSIYTLLSYCATIFACQDCTHIGNYQGGNVFMCDDNSKNSNIELNINIKVPYSINAPKDNTITQYPTKNINLKNENNTSLILHNLTNIEPLSNYTNNLTSSITSPSSFETNSPSSFETNSPSPSNSIFTEKNAPSSSNSILTEKNAPSPINTPSSKKIIDNNNKITDEEINPSVKSPGPSLRGTNNTKKNLSKTGKDKNTVKEINVGVIIAISVLSTLLVIMIICGIVYKVKFKKSKVKNINADNVEVDATEFRRKFEEAKKQQNTNKPKLPESKKSKNILLNSNTNNPKLPESKNSKKIPPAPLRKKRIITETPPPGMGFKKGDIAPEPNEEKKKRPVTPISES